MFQELYNEQQKLTVKVYICVIVTILVMISPYKSIMDFVEYRKHYARLAADVAAGPTQQSSEIALNDLFYLFSRNPFRGTWQSSIKISQFFQEEEGLFEIKSEQISSEADNSYQLRIRIFDGHYRQNGFYELSFNTKGLLTKQYLQTGKFLCDVVSPFISEARHGYIFDLHSRQSMYINRVKIKITSEMGNGEASSDGMLIEFLISSGYDINIIGRNIQEYQETLHDLIFAMVLFVEIGFTLCGIYRIYDSIYSHREYCERFSGLGLIAAAALDFTQAIDISLLCSESLKRFAVYSLPTMMIWIVILLMEIRVIFLVNSHQFIDNPYRLNLKIYGIFISVWLFSYFCNFHPLFFVLTCLVVILPQVWRNYTIGHKLKDNTNNYFMFALPRYLLLFYFRLYQYNAFDLRVNYVLCIVCFLLLLFQAALILAQMRFGVRAILPKFMHPSDFQYYFSQRAEIDQLCSICLIPLEQKSPEMNQMSRLQSEYLQNKIVETECRHKFHIECLSKWMETKLQCPNCRFILPPIEEYE